MDSRVVRGFGLLIAVLAFAVGTSSAAAQQIERYRELSETERTLYVMGFVGGLQSATAQVAIALGATTVDEISSFASMAWAGGGHESVDMSTCTNEWSWNQFRAVFDRYVEANPDIWHENVPVHLTNAVVAACRER